MNEDTPVPATGDKLPVSLETIALLILKVEAAPKTEREGADLRELNAYMEQINPMDKTMVDRFVAWHRTPQAQRDKPDDNHSYHTAV